MFDLPKAHDIVAIKARQRPRDGAHGMDEFRTDELEDHLGMHSAQFRRAVQIDRGIAAVTDGDNVIADTGHAVIVEYVWRKNMAIVAAAPYERFVRPLRG